MQKIFHAGILALSAFMVSLAAAQPSQPLKVGMELSYPPFEMTDAQGKPSGISVEIAQALAKALNRPLQIENIGYDGLIPALKTGKIDCIISSMTATAERAKSVDFSEPYLKTGLSLLLAAKSPVQKVEDLNSKERIVAVKKGTTGHQYATEFLPNAKLLILDKESAAVLEVSQGKADAFLYDQMSVLHNQARHPKTTKAILPPFRQESWAVAIRKGDKNLVLEINNFLKTFRSQGGFDRLGDKYLRSEKAAFEKAKVPFFF